MGTHKSSEFKYNWLNKCFTNAQQDKIILNEKRLIAQFCIVHHSTPRKAKELINIFITAEYIYRIGTELMSKELFDEERVI